MYHTLSKSKIMAFRQCPKRLWLELHRRDLLDVSAQSEAAFATGHAVGNLARTLYDSENKGLLIERHSNGIAHALDATQQALCSAQPIFEAGFTAAGGLSFADVLLPSNVVNTWRMVEVKSSTSVKPYYLDDAAIQTYIARQSGVALERVAIAYINNQFIYPGRADYRGLLAEQDVTAEIEARQYLVPTWINDALNIANQASEPTCKQGEHCNSPYECGFNAYCAQQQAPVAFPIAWLPRFPAKRAAQLQVQGITSMQQIGDEQLNELQVRVKDCTINNRVYLDSHLAKMALAQYTQGEYFLDFESSMFAIPIWEGCSPYTQHVFQFSLHRLHPDGNLEHIDFLDLSGNNPARPFAEALLAACAENLPIVVYNQTFEASRIKELATQFPDLSIDLRQLLDRMVDLLPIVRQCFYHPSQMGAGASKKSCPHSFPS